MTALLTEFSDVKISFFGGLTLKRVGEPEWDSKRSVLVASLEDLAAMKVAVIYQRAEARDYLDVAAILKRGIKLSQALSFAQAVYGERFNPLASLKALSYFEDGNLTIAAGTSETDFKQGSRRRNFD